MRKLVIAIDGPSGAGKGTVARAVASALDYRHVDSGAMYRAVGWKALQDGVALDDESAVSAVAERARIDVSNAAVTVDGRDVTRAIRTPQIDRAAAAVALRARHSGEVAGTRPACGRRAWPRYAERPVGQDTPVPPIPQYPPGFLARYCWW